MGYIGIYGKWVRVASLPERYGVADKNHKVYITGSLYYAPPCVYGLTNREGNQYIFAGMFAGMGCCGCGRAWNEEEIKNSNIEFTNIISGGYVNNIPQKHIVVNATAVAQWIKDEVEAFWERGKTGEQADGEWYDKELYSNKHPLTNIFL